MKIKVRTKPLDTPELIGLAITRVLGLVSQIIFVLAVFWGWDIRWVMFWGFNGLLCAQFGSKDLRYFFMGLKDDE